jgi:TonB family protein
MYFDFEDYKPDITPVDRVISWREGVLLSIIVHLIGIIVILTAPRWLPESLRTPRQVAVVQPQEQRESPRFVFVEPRVDMKALEPPEKAEPSDQDREARTRERAPVPANPLPRSEGNTRQRVEQMDRERARGRGPAPDPAAGQPAPPAPEPPQQEPPPVAELRLPEVPPAVRLQPPPEPAPKAGTAGRGSSGGSLGDSLRNLQRYIQRDQFENAQGGGSFGPAIQFDTKGVEFGPWIRRFIAQVRGNWEPLIPLAAMSMTGHVVVTFNVHKDGRITDLTVVGPSNVPAFNTAAYGALASSNPTVALPPEYPADQAFFTVTFFYNEDPQ